MICQRCLYRATTRAPLARSTQSTFTSQLQPLTARPATQRLTLTNSTQSQVNLSTSSNPQLSHLLTPTPPPTASTSAPKRTPTSSVPAGTPLRGLNYLKSSSEPLALDDDAYPAWLWHCLESTGHSGSSGAADGSDGGAEGADGDLFCTSHLHLPSSSSFSISPLPPFLPPHPPRFPAP